jgi:hypothetical protein
MNRVRVLDEVVSEQFLSRGVGTGLVAEDRDDVVDDLLCLRLGDAGLEAWKTRQRDIGCGQRQARDDGGGTGQSTGNGKSELHL